MASNREERRLMRQRGAGNRAAKDIDFGFGSAFGTPKLLLPGAPAPTAQQEPNIPRSQRSSLRRTPTPDQRQLTSPQLTRRTPTGSQNRSSSRSSPGSERNTHPRRQSVFDIPPDDDPDQGPVNKRRRITPFEPIPEDTVLSSRNIRDPETRTTAGAARSSPNARHELGEAEYEPHATPSKKDTAENEPQPASDGQLEIQNPEPVDIAVDETQEKSHSRSHKESPQRKRKKRKSVVQGPKRPKRPSVVDLPGTGPDQELEPEPEPQPEPGPGPEPGPELGRESEHEPEPEPRNEEAEREVEEPVRPPRRKPKKRKSIRQIPTKHKRRAPSVHIDTQEQQTEEQTLRSEEPDENSVDEDNEEENVENEESSQEKPTSPQQTTKPKRKLGRAVKEPSRRSPRRQPEEPEAAEAEAQEEPSQRRPQRKQRRRKPTEERIDEDEPKSRGGTVPVVVHRFANLSALQSITDDDEDAPSETAQPDDLPNRPKYPSRSGVNPADVLGQICRETLDKTISILENGIAQESNASRRAEWTRKRKAVELFGTELEQRLFDMSELLDSNFVLSARLKREKRDMASLRNRLVELRKEREDVALRIDEVRRKYTEDEHIKSEHENLNNSLHDLQLAIDRGRKVDDEHSADPAVGLEFLLRTVAQDVSSTASGSQGGILNQIRNFNSQLEHAATLLE